jgi:hypothetical protein
VSGIFNRFGISFGNLSRDVYIPEKPPTKKSGFDLHIWPMATGFCFIKGLCQKYKGFLETKRFLV